MFDSKEEWNISFAGCGFQSVYYLGALSCILERVPHLVHGASKICGASSGCLVAASLTVGIPIEKCCADLMSLAKEARKRKLGPLHPAFNLLQIVRDSLLSNLPEDAHVRASGKLCVSLTRVSDGKNVLVSEFDTREELIQVLVCSCFFPLYCGLIPPSYRGVRYVDGALTNNMPLFEQRNTITVSPFSGESDICPREGTINFHEVHHSNVSIQVNTSNVHRVTTAFFPPKPEVLAEICHNGYIDALRFLEENYLRIEHLSPCLVAVVEPTKATCCELVNEASAAEETESSKNTPLDRQSPPPEQHRWLDRRVIENLPIGIRKVLCEACRERHTGGSLLSQVTEFLPVKMASYLLIPCTLPVELILLLAKSVILSGCTAMRNLSTMAGDIYTKFWVGGAKDTASTARCSRSTEPERWNLGGEENVQPLTSVVDPTSTNDFYWNTQSGAGVTPLTPPLAPTSKRPTSNKSAFDEATLTPLSKAGSGSWSLRHRNNRRARLDQKL